MQILEDKQKEHTGQDGSTSGIEVCYTVLHRTEVDEGQVENSEQLPEQIVSNLDRSTEEWAARPKHSVSLQMLED